jgi:hypothetical protein
LVVVAWGRSILEPTRGHVRDGVVHDIDGAAVGSAICGTLLVDDLDPVVEAGEFDRCSVCLELVVTGDATERAG